METDDNSDLKPLMLSDLLNSVNAILAAHGDMPVGISIWTTENERLQHLSYPVSDPPIVELAEHVGWTRSYWIDQFDKVFVIDGSN